MTQYNNFTCSLNLNLFFLLLPSSPAICPPGWLSFAGSCYWIVSNINLLTTWHEALSKCSGMGSSLLIINR